MPRALHKSWYTYIYIHKYQVKSFYWCLHIFHVKRIRYLYLLFVCLFSQSLTNWLQNSWMNECMHAWMYVRLFMNPVFTYLCAVDYVSLVWLVCTYLLFIDSLTCQFIISFWMLMYSFMCVYLWNPWSMYVNVLLEFAWYRCLYTRVFDCPSPPSDPFPLSNTINTNSSTTNAKCTLTSTT